MFKQDNPSGIRRASFAFFATFALQKHGRDNQSGNNDIVRSVTYSFYVDNCLDSVETPEQGLELVTKLREPLTLEGFNIHQWARNSPSVVEQLPSDARSDACDLWLIVK